MGKVVMGLSGGMDSATLLGKALHHGDEVEACIFTYGSKHNPYENHAAFKIIEFYQKKGFPVSGHFFDLSEIMKEFNSALLMSGEEIPEGHYNDDNMKKTVVPGRNLIFSSIMAGLAESVEAAGIALGVHSGDHHIYPDCRPDFIGSLSEAIGYSSDGKLKVYTPFIDMDKTSILLLGYSLSPNVPYELTRTCYKNQELSCGKCGSCTERLEAFANINRKDPIVYE